VNHHSLKEDLSDAQVREQKLLSVLKDLIDDLEIRSSTEALRSGPCFQRAKRTLIELCKSDAV